jgi:hypothetical protein
VRSVARWCRRPVSGHPGRATARRLRALRDEPAGVFRYGRRFRDHPQDLPGKMASPMGTGSRRGRPVDELPKIRRTEARDGGRPPCPCVRHRAEDVQPGPHGSVRGTGHHRAGSAAGARSLSAEAASIATHTLPALHPSRGSFPVVSRPPLGSLSSTVRTGLSFPRDSQSKSTEPLIATPERRPHSAYPAVMYL